MARKTVAALLVDVLAEAGVERVYGVPGDSLNGITDSIRVRQNISWVGVRHEEAAAFAAGAEAHLSGKLAVCAGRYHEDISLREAALKLGLLNAQQFDSWVRPEEMTHPLRGKQ
jgi:hypothetical protein